jgi:glyoxylase-like metal-dependent hydrolase (beta-lactamase superfamily II)
MKLIGMRGITEYRANSIKSRAIAKSGGFVSDQRLRLQTIVSMPFAENTHIANLAERSDCLVVDPGFEPEKIIAYLDRHRLTPAAILNTHGHPDHIAGNAAIKQRWPACPLVIGHADADKLTDARVNLSVLLGLEVVSPPADVLLREGDVYEAAGFRLEVYEIPGHSAGHIVFVWRDHQPMYVFGGDVLFAGSVGRTDFPGGDFPLLAAGIRQKLFALPDDTVVLCGHGEATTIGRERRTNPFVGDQAGDFCPE